MGFLEFLNKLIGRNEPMPVKENTSPSNVPKKYMEETELMRILEQSEMSTVRITATVEDNMPLTASKFLGKPYFPANKNYPTDKTGKPMIMLAQINFAEVPHLNNYPEAGILQFYIAAKDDLYGVNFDDFTDQTSFRVLFHTIVDENNLNPSVPVFNLRNDDVYTPITVEHRLTFRLEKEYVPHSDWRFEMYFGKNYFDFSSEYENDALWEKYETGDIANPGGHKIGGYAYFTQWDPRSKESYSDYILLLQIDSEGDHILWGDVGVGNLFIREEDLKRLDFSSVLYTWDCY